MTAPPPAALAPGSATTELEFSDGTKRTAHQWAACADAVDHRLLARVEGPALDIGCGPARATLALAQAGVAALGIDITPDALTIARARGATVLERCVFGRLPGAGRWGTALLLDGNIGIGGDPVGLLERIGELVRPGGIVLIETDHPGAAMPSPCARLLVDGQPGPWFPWAAVAADAVPALASQVPAMALQEQWHDGFRWFSALRTTGDR